MESSDLEVSTPGMSVKQIGENYRRLLEEIDRKKAARGNDGDAKKNAEKMRMVRRHKESDSSDEEMKIAKEQVKRLMEKAVAIPENGDATKIEDSKAEIEDSKVKIEDSKAAEVDETMFPRRRGRFIRYLRRQRSESQDSAAFQIRENMTSTLTSEESFMSYSDDSVE
ncbi:unnamed protein product [Arabis nemorensis]|uniref:Uncharacterized protein n=1 Tax=Arabis nemorensis TaxID=586526 RepID=A0A565C7A7_9BRAS|nr:unnamed protein product [Arabis nemorensis]